MKLSDIIALPFIAAGIIVMAVGLHIKFTPATAKRLVGEQAQAVRRVRAEVGE